MKSNVLMVGTPLGKDSYHIGGSTYYSKCPVCYRDESSTRIYCGTEYKGCISFCMVPTAVKDPRCKGQK